MAFCKLSLSFFYDLLQGQDSSEVFHQKFEKISRNISAQISLYVYALMYLLMLTMLQWPPPHGMGHSSSAAPPLGSLCGGGAEIESLNLPKNSAVVACFASPARSRARCPLPSAVRRVRIASSMRTPHPARPLLRSPPSGRPTDIHHYIVMPDRFRAERGDEEEEEGEFFPRGEK